MTYQTLCVSPREEIVILGILGGCLTAVALGNTADLVLVTAVRQVIALASALLSLVGLVTRLVHINLLIPVYHRKGRSQHGKKFLEPCQDFGEIEAYPKGREGEGVDFT